MRGRGYRFVAELGAPRVAQMASASRSSVPPSLVGRDADLDALREELTRGKDGRGRLCAITGEAGIGKTSLLAALAQDARERPRQTSR